MQRSFKPTLTRKQISQKIKDYSEKLNPWNGMQSRHKYFLLLDKNLFAIHILVIAYNVQLFWTGVSEVL